MAPGRFQLHFRKVTFRIFLVIEAFSGVMNIYINMHMLTIISKTVCLGDTKQNILIQKHIHFFAKSMLPYHTCLNSVVMTYQVPLHIMHYCELYNVPQQIIVDHICRPLNSSLTRSHNTMKGSVK